MRKRYEYMVVNGADVVELNAIGLGGWRPAEIRHTAGHYDTPCNPNDWVEESWSGLFYREVEEP